MCWSVLRYTAKNHADATGRYEIKFILQRVRHHSVWVPTQCYGFFFGEICNEKEAGIQLSWGEKREMPTFVLVGNP
jgi:hypothetical protein